MNPPTVGELLLMHKGHEDDVDMVRVLGALLAERPLGWLEYAEFILRRTLRLRFPTELAEGIRYWIPNMMKDLQTRGVDLRLEGNFRTFDVALYNGEWLQWTGSNVFAHTRSTDFVRHLGSTPQLDCHIVHFRSYWNLAVEQLYSFRENRYEWRPTVDEASTQPAGTATSIPVA